MSDPKRPMGFLAGVWVMVVMGFLGDILGDGWWCGPVVFGDGAQRRWPLSCFLLELGATGACAVAFGSNALLARAASLSSEIATQEWRRLMVIRGTQIDGVLEGYAVLDLHRPEYSPRRVAGTRIDGVLRFLFGCRGHMEEYFFAACAIFFYIFVQDIFLQSLKCLLCKFLLEQVFVYILQKNIIWINLMNHSTELLNY